jgi:hypothetical protein
MLENVYVEGDFEYFGRELNLAAREGRQFVLMTPIGSPEGKKLVNTQLIMTADEVEDNAFPSL